MGEGRKLYRVLVGNPGGKRPLERPKRRWENGLKIDLREIGWGVWIGFTWLRIGTVGGCCECGGEPTSFGATDLVSDHQLTKYTRRKSKAQNH
jgi:hypothetical protein